MVRRPAEKRTPPAGSATSGQIRMPPRSSHRSPTTARSPITASLTTAPASTRAPAPITEFTTTASAPTTAPSNSIEPSTRAPAPTRAPRPIVLPPNTLRRRVDLGARQRQELAGRAGQRVRGGDAADQVGRAVHQVRGVPMSRQ